LMRSAGAAWSQMRWTMRANCPRSPNVGRLPAVDGKKGLKKRVQDAADAVQPRTDEATASQGVAITGSTRRETWAEECRRSEEHAQRFELKPRRALEPRYALIATHPPTGTGHVRSWLRCGPTSGTSGCIRANTNNRASLPTPFAMQRPP
jgi:hypothetical protein